MVDLRRVPVVWSGLTGLPGLSVFYTFDPDDVTTNLATFFSAISNRFPNGLTWSCAGSGDTIESTTGHLSGSWTGGTPFSQTGSGGATGYAAGVGTFLIWQTPQIIGTRRLKGRTFLVPLLSTEYQSDGSINAATNTTFQTAANTLVGTAKLVVWHRPDPGGSNGLAVTTTAATLPDRVTSLRTRRT